MTKAEAPKNLIFSCSGAADVGGLADQTARELTRCGDGKIFCLASMAAGITKKIEMARAAETVLVMNGCSLDCASKILDNSEISYTTCVRLTDEGFEKGKSPANAENIAKAVDVVRGAVAK